MLPPPRHRPSLLVSSSPDPTSKRRLLTPPHQGQDQRCRKRREPAAFRAQRAHVRSRGPRIESARAARAGVPGRLVEPGCRSPTTRRRTGNPESPCPPATWPRTWSSQDRGRVYMRDLASDLPSVDPDALVAPRPARSRIRCVSLLGPWSYVKGVLLGHTARRGHGVALFTGPVSRTTRTGSARETAARTLDLGPDGRCRRAPPSRDELGASLGSMPYRIRAAAVAGDAHGIAGPALRCEASIFCSSSSSRRGWAGSAEPRRAWRSGGGAVHRRGSCSARSSGRRRSPSSTWPHRVGAGAARHRPRGG